MKKNEQKLSHELFGVMGNSWHGQRHEDKYSVGICDVSFSAVSLHGWVELKVLPKEPPAGRAFDFDYEHLTPQQRNWMTKRCAAGGHCWLYCGMGLDIRVLWYWPTLSPLLGVLTYERIRAHGSAWLRRPTGPSFISQAESLIAHHKRGTEPRGTPRTIDNQTV